MGQLFHCWFIYCHCSHKTLLFTLDIPCQFQVYSSFYFSISIPAWLGNVSIFFHYTLSLLLLAVYNFFFVWFEAFFVLVNHKHACLLMVSLLVFWNTSFLCLEEVCSQRSGSILKLFCPSELHLTGSFLPLLNKSVCSSEVHNLYSSPCLPHFPQDLEFPWVIYYVATNNDRMSEQSTICRTCCFILILQKCYSKISKVGELKPFLLV